MRENKNQEQMTINRKEHWASTCRVTASMEKGILMEMSLIDYVDTSDILDMQGFGQIEITQTPSVFYLKSHHYPKLPQTMLLSWQNDIDNHSHI